MIPLHPTAPPVADLALRLSFARQAALYLLGLTFVAGAWAAEARDDETLRAVRRQEAATWSRLVAGKTGVTARDGSGNTALHLAALNHDTAAVRALLAAGAAVDARNSAEATPLIYGAGRAEIVDALLKAGADANAASALKTTPLLVAVAHPESFAAAQLLVKAGADVKVTRGQEPGGVLGIAVTGGDRRTIDFLLEQGAGADSRALAVALVTAAAEGNLDVVRLLRARGADITFARGAGHALNVALFAEQLDVAHYLIAEGANPNVRSTNGHGTPTLVFAAYNQAGDPTAAKALIAAGVDVNVANEHGMTALAYALRNGPQTPLADYLRTVGARAPEPARGKAVPNRAVPATPAGRVAVVKARMPATLDLLQRSSDAFLDNKFVQQQACTSCHGQDLPPVAYALARDRGFAIDEVSLGRQIAAQTSRWKGRAERARQMMPPVPGALIAVAYGLFGLQAMRHPADDMTDAMVRWLLRTQKLDGKWNDITRRPPMEDGAYVATGWVPLSIRDYAPAGSAGAVAESHRRSATWLRAHEPASHNELAFQVLGLHWSRVPVDGIRSYAARLIGAQRPDGGWAQLPGLDSDAWATGTALYALHEAAGVKPDDPVYQRGVEFLLRTQFEDGSWWVRSRAWPFQPHFNGQFPHGKDQWISQGATAWAAVALLFTLEPGVPPDPALTSHQLMAAYARSPAAARKSPAAVAAAGLATAGEGTVNFSRDIKPILDRSCAGCHGAEKKRGGFEVASRASLLKGGASGEPAIVPGQADESPLIQYVTGKIEDLEMPPLDRREKYPGLTAAEVELLRTWIDAGVPGAPEKTAAASGPAGRRAP